MSHHTPYAAAPRLNIPQLRAAKGSRKLVVLAAYTAPVDQLVDAACDILLVGDSLGMVVYGMDSTLPVTLDMMIAHGAAVVRGSAHACVVVDMLRHQSDMRHDRNGAGGEKGNRVGQLCDSFEPHRAGAHRAAPPGQSLARPVRAPRYRAAAGRGSSAGWRPA